MPPQKRVWRMAEKDHIKPDGTILAGWLSWLESHPVQPKVVSFFPSQGTYLGCRFDAWSGLIQEATNWCFSLSVSLPSFLSKSNKHIFRWEFLKDGGAQDKDLIMLSERQWVI